MLKTTSSIIQASQIATPISLPGDVTLSTGNLVIGTAGKGIDFSADPSAAGMTSELLDDYEEGTFTPTVVGVTTAGTATYSIQVGTYTRIGNRVLFQAYVSWTLHTGTGNMRISGLPFNSNNTIPNSLQSLSLWTNELSLTITNVPQAYILQGGTQIILQQVPTGGGSVSNIPVDAAASIMVAGHYFV
jgi:hypothetical protein